MGIREDARREFELARRKAEADVRAVQNMTRSQRLAYLDAGLRAWCSRTGIEAANVKQVTFAHPSLVIPEGLSFNREGIQFFGWIAFHRRYQHDLPSPYLHVGIAEPGQPLAEIYIQSRADLGLALGMEQQTDQVYGVSNTANPSTSTPTRADIEGLKVQALHAANEADSSERRELKLWLDQEDEARKERLLRALNEWSSKAEIEVTKYKFLIGDFTYSRDGSSHYSIDRTLHPGLTTGIAFTGSGLEFYAKFSFSPKRQGYLHVALRYPDDEYQHYIVTSRRHVENLAELGHALKEARAKGVEL